MSTTAERSPPHPAAAPASRTPDNASREGRVADYIADVLFIVILAAPLVIFGVPASVPDAVVADHAAVVAPADPAYTPQPE